MPAPKKRRRKVPLNCTVGEEIRAAGHSAAYRRGRSLSELVAEFILRMAKEDAEAAETAAPKPRKKKR